MTQWWLIVGSEANWRVAFASKNIWGLKDFRELRALWNMAREGDGLLFYVSKPVHGIVGTGNIVAKFHQTIPLWPEEVKRNETLWPLRFEFDVEYCLPPDTWRVNRYTSHDLQMISRMVFQGFPEEEVRAARSALGLSPDLTAAASYAPPAMPASAGVSISHAEVQRDLSEIGRIQHYIADQEYPLENTRLDVVWRRIERSVPTFAFEVQIGGDIYHAMAKLKHAHDIWNSRIFLVSSSRDHGQYQELASGPFHEVAQCLRFIDVGAVKQLLGKKRDYKSMEQALGILP